MEPYTEKLEADRESKNKAFLDFTGSVIDIVTEEEHHDEEEHEESGHGHDHGGMDPHVWLSPREYIKMAHLIEAKVHEVFPNIDTTA